MILSSRWVTFCAPGAIIVVMVLAEYLWDILACNGANARALLIHHGSLLGLVLTLHIVVKGVADRVLSAHLVSTVCKSLA